MSRRTCGYIFSALLVAGACAAACAQEKAAAVDTTARRFIPTGVRVGTDILAIGMSQYRSDFKGWEVAADVDFYRWYLVAEYGAWSTDDLIDNGLYTNDGTYFRIGVDVNFLFKDPQKNMFFIGGRFGHCTFSDQLTYTYDVGHFPPSSFNVSNPSVTGTWVELTSGLKIKIWRIFWLGATGRFKFGLDLDGNGDLTSYDVPGYGKSFKTTWWGFNYYALVRIPFKRER
jgi:hypothetical protein